jgi:hypothetical protein
MFSRHSTCAFGSFLILPFASEFNNLGTTHEQRKKQNRELRFFSGLGLLTHALAHLQWQEPPRFIDASATSRVSIN